MQEAGKRMRWGLSVFPAITRRRGKHLAETGRLQNDFQKDMLRLVSSESRLPACKPDIALSNLASESL
jgi:hypothetical protein